MCYTCGCRKPDDDHGDPRNLVNDHFEAAGEAMDLSPEEPRKNTLDLLQDVDLESGQL